MSPPNMQLIHSGKREPGQTSNTSYASKTMIYITFQNGHVILKRLSNTLKTE